MCFFFFFFARRTRHSQRHAPVGDAPNRWAGQSPWPRNTSAVSLVGSKTLSAPASSLWTPEVRWKVFTTVIGNSETLENYFSQYNTHSLQQEQKESEITTKTLIISNNWKGQSSWCSSVTNSPSGVQTGCGHQLLPCPKCCPSGEKSRYCPKCLAIQVRRHQNRGRCLTLASRKLAAFKTFKGYSTSTVLLACFEKGYQSRSKVGQQKDP